MKAPAHWLLLFIRVFFPLTLVLLLSGCGTRSSPASPQAPGPAAPASFALQSPDFQPGERLPAEFTCEGENRPPRLAWGDPPAGTRSLALVMSDPDAPGGTFLHWLVYNLPAETRSLGGEAPLPAGAREGRNDFGRKGYGGPCPPPGDRPHRYVFKLYALGALLDLPAGADLAAFTAAVNGQVLGEATLEGLYSR